MRGSAGGASARRETPLANVSRESRRGRALDMERRLRPYRALAFVFLGIALISTGSRLGWGWLVPLAVGLAGFALVDRFAQRSNHPERWFAVAWAFTPLAIAGGVALTGGAESPALMWLSLPAVSLGARFETKGLLLGCGYIVALLLLSTVALDPAAAADHYEQLVFAVTLVLGVVTLSGALADAERAYRHHSTVDALTGILNRGALDQRIRELEDGSDPGAGGGRTAFLLCDLDNFKRVNDAHGHAMGDTVLTQAARVMRDSLRGSDSVYRVGGEEFVAVLPDSDMSGAVEVAERMRRAVDELRPEGLRVTMSVGVATGVFGEGANETVGRADAALYRAKAAGRDRVQQA
jgi:diguanylate cyclase (GGDEF)-like protein